MKKNKFSTILFAAFIAFASCNQKEQVPGPQGPAGKDALSLLLRKDGFIRGNIYITNQLGEDSLISDFNYEYTSALANNQSFYTKGENASFFIARSDSTVSKRYFKFQGRTDLSQGSPSSQDLQASFYFEKDLGNGKYLRFGQNSDVFVIPKMEFSNYTFNISTGRLKSDFTIIYEGRLPNIRRSKVIGNIDINLQEPVPLRKGIVSY
ncbi:MAG: hypothetical protein J7604_00550 [Sporocytophaga sp.]|uniref:hypothetical protein n=1 Tax=Sporocytophaga sp. TaxID=2231183 RepID=UPI001B1A536F|nr:hypothetical protein [Sporocytophaga sp.]MBO9698659.1 hypothetical protein [Sporocytophaga sp.]